MRLVENIYNENSFVIPQEMVNKLNSSFRNRSLKEEAHKLWVSLLPVIYLIFLADTRLPKCVCYEDV